MHSYNNQELFNQSLTNAQEQADTKGVALAHGYDSYAGWTTVDASDEFAVAELGDVSIIKPSTKV
ncbi:MAG: hypothetical protein KUG73_07090 [Pseudomonadales bacterium]|nr:hypothetical protein [Pseudomonadales bacterium]